MKVGGSLLDLGDFPLVFSRWLQRLPRPALIIVGGGEAADYIRTVSTRFAIPDPAAHWLAMRAMRLQAEVVRSLVPGLAIADDLDAASHWLHAGAPACLFDPFDLLWADGARSLPANWQVTSDSIAAFVTRQAGAGMLYLLKSVGKAAPLTAADAVRWNWLDPAFPRIGQGLTVEWVNLRTGWTAPLVMA